MKFEVRYPTGARHEVELQGTLVVLGRDPSCDLVLSDVKCSRRHAVIEAGSQGLLIRDTGSANGIYVNGRRTERSALAPGDVVRLGEMVVKVLPEEVEGTLAMAPEELAALGERLPAAAAVPSGPTDALEAAPLPSGRASFGGAPTATLRGPLARPLTVTVLASLWVLSVPVFGAGGLMLALRLGLARPLAIAAGLLGLGLAALAALMVFGLFARKSWARPLQLALAALGVLLCPFSLAAVTVLVYLWRAESKVHFSGRRDYAELSLDEQRLLRAEGAEAAFSGTLLGAVALGLLVTLLGFFYLAPRLASTPPPLADARALADVRAVIAAQRNFRAGTASSCGLLYADLDGLLRPAGAIPNYRADGPAFVGRELAQPVRGPYRYELSVSDPVAAAAPGCPTRAFRSYQYTAVPLGGQGRHFLAGPEGKIHAAEDRPATFTDPIVD